MEDERNVIEKILAGETGYYRDLIEAHRNLVIHIAFRMVDNSDDREDICQEVFIKAYQNLSGFRHNAKFSTWLGKITYNTCLNYLTKKKVPLYDDIAPEGETIESQPGETSAPDKIASEGNISDILKLEIGSLPTLHRTVLTLYHLDGLSYREIGEVMDLPEGTVKSYLFRARKSLKKRLSGKYRKEEICG